jgi:O-antigen/teichoic acid export membrane protein
MWYKLTDKTVFGMYLSIAGAIVTLAGNMALIPILGYFGSALTTLLCYLSMAFLSWYYGQKYYPIPYQLFKICGYILFAVFLVLLSHYIPSKDWISDMALRALLILIYPIVVYLLEIKKISAKLS